VTESVFVAEPVAPPPKTIAVKVCGLVELFATLTVTVTAGKVPPTLTLLLFVQVIDAESAPHVQPFGLIPAAVRPDDKFSVKVVVPNVAAPAVLLAVTVKVWPSSPCVNVPLPLSVALTPKAG
jgi:hypothetical protein